MALGVGCGSDAPTGPSGAASTNTCPDGAAELLGDSPIHRPVALRVVLRPSRELQADTNAMLAHVEAAAEVTAATKGAVSFQVSADADGDVVLFSRLDGGQSTAGSAQQQLAGDVVVSGSIVFRDLYSAGRRPIVAHEILHWLGLPNHSTQAGDIMCPCSEDPNRVISAREATVVRYLLTLQPGLAGACR